MSYKIPKLIPARDSLFDRYKCKVEHNGWLFYIGGGPKIVVVTPEEMASQGRREHLCEIPIENDEQFHRWVLDFISINKLR